MFGFLFLEGVTLYVVFGLVTLGILYIAWISTFVRNQHNLTLLIWPARDPPRRMAFLHLLVENMLSLNDMPVVFSNSAIFDELTAENNGISTNGEMDEEESTENSEDELESEENTSPLLISTETIENTSNVNLAASNQISESIEETSSPTTESRDTDSSTTETPQTCDDESVASHTEGVIRIKLKYLDDRQKTVIGNASQLILDFKRKFFNLELSEHRVVRLIFQGKLLKDDHLTLASYGIHDDSVVHCHISQPKPPVAPIASNLPTQNQPSASRRRILLIADETQPAAQPSRGLIENFTDGLDLSNFIVAVLWVVVGMLWFIRINHSHLFSSFSTLVLLFLTMLLIVPHYIMAVDVQLNVDLNNSTMRNLGIERILVLPETPTLRSGENRNLGSSSTDAAAASAETTDASAEEGTGEQDVHFRSINRLEEDSNEVAVSQ